MADIDCFCTYIITGLGSIRSSARHGIVGIDPPNGITIRCLLRYSSGLFTQVLHDPRCWERPGALQPRGQSWCWEAWESWGMAIVRLFWVNECTSLLWTFICHISVCIQLISKQLWINVYMIPLTSVCAWLGCKSHIMFGHKLLLHLPVSIWGHGKHDF